MGDDTSYWHDYARFCISQESSRARHSRSRESIGKESANDLFHLETLLMAYNNVPTNRYQHLDPCYTTLPNIPTRNLQSSQTLHQPPSSSDQQHISQPSSDRYSVNHTTWTQPLARITPAITSILHHKITLKCTGVLTSSLDFRSPCTSLNTSRSTLSSSSTLIFFSEVLGRLQLKLCCTAQSWLSTSESFCRKSVIMQLCR